jgi:hypothetical protein
VPPSAGKLEQDRQVRGARDRDQAEEIVEPPCAAVGAPLKPGHARRQDTELKGMTEL